MNVKSVLRQLTVVAAFAGLALPALAKDDALSLVPANAVTVGMVKLSEMRSSPLSSMLFEHTDKMTVDGDAAKFLAEAGLSPTKDVDVLVVATSPRTSLGTEADVVVIAEGRFVPERLIAALVSRGATKKDGYVLLQHEGDTDHDTGAVAFPSTSLAIAGSERAVVAALAARASGGTGFRTRGLLGADVARVDTAATAWALVDVQRASRLAKGGNVNTGHGQSGAALQQALKTLSTFAVWAIDKGDSLELAAVGTSADAETLQLIEDTVRGALSALRLAVKDKAPDMIPVLRRFDVSQSAGLVKVEGSIPAATLRDFLAKKTAAAK
jgi:hypothetical protein